MEHARMGTLISAGNLSSNFHDLLRCSARLLPQSIVHTLWSQALLAPRIS